MKKLCFAVLAMMMMACQPQPQTVQEEVNNEVNPVIENILTRRSVRKYQPQAVNRDTMTRIYEEDRAPFLNLFSKESVIRELDAQGVFTTTYRLIDTGSPMYVNMKITRMPGGNRIIMGISIIDAQMQKELRFRESQH